MEAIKERHVERLKELTYLQEMLKRQSKLRDLIDKEGKNIQLERIIGGMTDITEFRNANDSLHIFVEPFDVVNITQDNIPMFKFNSLADKDNSYLITHQTEQTTDRPLSEVLKLVDDEINKLYAKLNITEGERPRRAVKQKEATWKENGYIKDVLNKFEEMELQLHSLKGCRSKVVNVSEYDDKLNKIQNDLTELEDCLIGKPLLKANKNNTVTVQVRVSVDVINATESPSKKREDLPFNASSIISSIDSNFETEKRQVGIV
jgi:hypothetical protein